MLDFQGTSQAYLFAEEGPSLTLSVFKAKNAKIDAPSLTFGDVMNYPNLAEGG